MRVSQMDQILGDVSKSVRNRSLSRSSQRQSASLYNGPTLITSIEGELLGHRGELLGHRDDEVEEKIEEGGEGGVSEGGKVRKRRRNKHANRYK
jgi:hypothetical protein